MQRRGFLKGLLGLLASPLLPAVAKPAPKYFEFAIKSEPIVTSYPPASVIAFIPEVWSEKCLMAFFTRAAAEDLAKRIDEDVFANLMLEEQGPRAASAQPAVD